MSTPTSVKRHAQTCPEVLKYQDKTASLPNSEDPQQTNSSDLPTDEKMNKYKIIKPLDKGSFGEVSLATLTAKEQAEAPTAGITCVGSPLRRNRSEPVFVIKKIDKGKANPNLLTNEIEAGSRLKENSFIPKFVEHYTDSKFCYMVFEYFQGVNLYTYLESRNFKPIREHHVKRIMRQLADALIYCHQNKICHRDLKLENILYSHKRKQANLIDFGLCAINSISCADMCNNWCGSPDYVCPEILIQQPYSGCLSDVWSLGVILYVLLFGQMPFNFKERYYALHHGDGHPEVEFPSDRDIPHRVSDSAKDLIKRMLTVDPRKRISMEEIPHHKWIQKTNILSIFGFKTHKEEYHSCASKHAEKENLGDYPAHSEQGDKAPATL